MKRIFAFLTALLMLLLASCGGAASSMDTTEAGAPDGTSAPSADVTDEPATTEADPIAHLPDTKYDGHEFVVLMTNLNSNASLIRDFLVSEDNTVLDEALYRRNMIVMDALNITFTGIAEYGSSSVGLNKIRQANSAGDSNYDMGIISTYDAGALALSGDLRDLNDYGYLDMSKSWWDQNAKNDLEVKGRLYFTAGDISLVATQAMYNMVFNKTLFDERNWEYPYALVEQGVWTFDKMKEYVLQVSEDLDANDIMDSNDRYGLGYIHSSVVAALNMSGERIANKDENGNIVLTLGTERAESAIVSFIELTKDKQHVYNCQTATGGKNSVTMITDGHVLFRMVEHLGFPQFRDTELNYGILPLPKTDEAQDRYYTPLGGYDAAFVCVPSFTADDERTSAIIEYTAYISSRVVTPAYYEKTLVGRYISDNDSYNMITIELENRIYDIGYIYNIGGLKDMVANLSKAYSTAFASAMKSYSRKAENDITKINEYFKGE
ncbi:MAG: extracellular solute-binding protein [Clostridia bacterium]|nr:extracellular solute-binding protein [Clostridia bacterium]